MAVVEPALFVFMLYPKAERLGSGTKRGYRGSLSIYIPKGDVALDTNYLSGHEVVQLQKATRHEFLPNVEQRIPLKKSFNQ